MKLMSDLELSGKRVLIREDLNVPIRGGVITNDARLRAAVPTLNAALDQGAAVMVMSHLGRPVEGEWQEEVSLHPSRSICPIYSGATCCWPESGAEGTAAGRCCVAGERALQLW